MNTDYIGFSFGKTHLLRELNIYSASKNSKVICLAPYFNYKNKEHLLVAAMAKGVGSVEGKGVVVATILALPIKIKPSLSTLLLIHCQKTSYVSCRNCLMVKE